MTTADELDRRASELVATGAVFALLLKAGGVDVEIADGADLVVWFPFLRSAYRVTVAMVTDEEAAS